MFEVKATTTDDMAFDLSEKEIAVAQANAGHDRYRILFVGRVNDSENRWISVLPNPLSAQGRGRYRIVGRGIRYEFAVERHRGRRPIDRTMHGAPCDDAAGVHAASPTPCATLALASRVPSRKPLIGRFAEVNRASLSSAMGSRAV